MLIATLSIHGGQDMETTEVSFGRWLDTEMWFPVLTLQLCPPSLSLLHLKVLVFSQEHHVMKDAKASAWNQSVRQG